MRQFESISFTHVYRESNFVAYLAAALGHSFRDLKLSMNGLPFQAIYAHNFDLLNIGCNRGFTALGCNFLFLIQKNKIKNPGEGPRKHTTKLVEKRLHTELKLKTYRLDQLMMLQPKKPNNWH